MIIFVKSRRSSKCSVSGRIEVAVVVQYYF